MKALHHLGPSPEHAHYAELMPEFWKKVQQQEKEAIERGLPAKGMFEFGRRWFDAWANQSVEQLRACMSEDCGFIDASTFQNKRVNREETLANSAAAFEAMPDLAFYAQDATLRSLPYADYFDGQWRMVIPWRGIARWTGPLRVPGMDVALPPSGRCFNFIGVDRYTLTEDWQISHIDTDWDQLYAFIQLSPVRIPAPSLRAVRLGAGLARLITPALRFLSRNEPNDAHRSFDLPLTPIASAADWSDIHESSVRTLADARAQSSA